MIHTKFRLWFGSFWIRNQSFCLEKYLKYSEVERIIPIETIKMTINSGCSSCRFIAMPKITQIKRKLKTKLNHIIDHSVKCFSFYLEGEIIGINKIEKVSYEFFSSQLKLTFRIPCPNACDAKKLITRKKLKVDINWNTPM